MIKRQDVAPADGDREEAEVGTGAGGAVPVAAENGHDPHNARLARLQDELLRSLPSDIRRARKAYHRVADEAAGIMDAKGFVNYQSACKAALAHVESLIKLLRWVRDGELAAAVAGAGGDKQTGAPGAGQKTADDNGDDIARLIADAREALQPAGRG